MISLEQYFAARVTVPDYYSRRDKRFYRYSGRVARPSEEGIPNKKLEYYFLMDKIGLVFFRYRLCFAEISLAMDELIKCI